jgi:YtkA-like
MRRLIRTTLALTLLAALAAVSAATAMAGNYAETLVIGGGETPPTAGEERELRVLLLQHGITPVDHGSVELTAWLPGTDETVSVMATSVGSGEWVATVTFPTAGDWQLRFLHSEFETPPAAAFAVGESAGSAWLPAAGSIGALLLLAVVLIVVARRIGGGDAASEPITEPARAG